MNSEHLSIALSRTLQKVALIAIKLSQVFIKITWSLAPCRSDQNSQSCNHCAAAGTGNQPRKVLRPVSQPSTPQAIQQLQSQGLLKSGGLTADGKRIIIMKKPATGTTLTPKIQSVSSGNTPTTFVMAPRTASTSTVTKVVMANSSSAMPISATGQKKNPTCQECKTKPSKFECVDLLVNRTLHFYFG